MFLKNILEQPHEKVILFVLHQFQTHIGFAYLTYLCEAVAKVSGIMSSLEQPREEGNFVCSSLISNSDWICVLLCSCAKVQPKFQASRAVCEVATKVYH